MAKVGIVGASGYAGAELVRLSAAHPELELAWVSGETQAGVAVADLYPHLAPVAGGLLYERFAPAMADGLDAVLLALPHGASGTIMGDLLPRARVVVDLAADFRLRDPELYPRWYGQDHPEPELLARFAYGLPELFRSGLQGATAVAVPGCYPTAAAMALAPLVRAGAIETDGVIVDAASGITGAGRKVADQYLFSARDGDFTAYGLLDHRHTPEIEQATGASVLFTPHLAPMSRGILATCYARLASPATTAQLLQVMGDAYAGEQFVTVSDRPPSTKATTGSNSAHLTVRVDPRTGWVVVLCAIDNLVKGAAGQAIQCLNIVLGLDEGLGLSAAGLAP